MTSEAASEEKTYKTLHDLFMTELADVYSAENQLVKALPKMAEAIDGLRSEGDELAASFKGSPACDATIISACQKVEHYEIASYGCLKEWAGLLGNLEASTMLEAILAEEKRADESFSSRARAASNSTSLSLLCLSHRLSALARAASNAMALEEYAAEAAKTTAKRNDTTKTVRY